MGQSLGRTAAKISPEEWGLQAGESQFTMLGFLHFMLSYSPLSPSFHSSPSTGLQKTMWHCLILCLQNALHFYLHPVLLCFFPPKFLNTYYARYSALHSFFYLSIVLYLLTLFLTRFMISHFKQRVHCARTDLVCPWRWLFCLWESPWWIEIPLMPAMCASGHFHSPSLWFNSLQRTMVFVWCATPALLSLQESTVNVVLVLSHLCFFSTNYWFCGSRFIA